MNNKVSSGFSIDYVRCNSIDQERLPINLNTEKLFLKLRKDHPIFDHHLPKNRIDWILKFDLRQDNDSFSRIRCMFSLSSSTPK